MKNFELLQKDVEIQPILDELAHRPEAWFAQRGREQVTVQRESNSIPIRGLRASKIAGRQRRDVHESRFTTLSRSFPAVVSFLRRIARERGAKLARCKVVRLPAGGRVYPHVDRGEYYRGRDRFHLILASEGSWMRAGDEDVSMRTGELWWFDNKQVHEARNDSASDRIHLIFDLEPRRAKQRVAS